MREKRIFLTVATAILVGIVLLSIIGVKVKAQTETATVIYVDNLTNRTTVALSTPLILPAFAGTVPRTINFYIRVARAPQLSTEPTALLTDKTFAWQARLSWDPLYFKIATPTTQILQKNFLQRNMYSFSDPDNSWADTGALSADESWSLATSYKTSDVQFTYDEAGGTVLVGNTLLGFDPTTTPLPPEYLANADNTKPGFYAPDKGRHGGNFYDLPYTTNTTQAVTQPDGSSVTDPNYNTMVQITLTQTALLPAGTEGYRTFHLNDTLLFEYDAKTPYEHKTWDAYIGGIPTVPEFPLGLGIIMLMAPAIPVAYIWKSKRNKKK